MQRSSEGVKNSRVSSNSPFNLLPELKVDTLGLISQNESP